MRIKNLLFNLINMSNLVKSIIFWKKEVSDEELLQKWLKSDKTPEEFNTSIILMKSNSKVIIREISQVKLRKIGDIKNLLSFLLKNQPTTTSSTRKNKLVFIIDNLQFILRLYSITNLDSLVYFAFSNKYDIFSFIVQNISKYAELGVIMSDVYYKKDIYIEMVQYYLMNDSDRELRILLPNESNSTKLIKMNSVPILFNLKKIFKESFQNNIDSLSELWFNIMLYFHSNNMVFQKLNKYLPNENKPINLIIEVYAIANDIDQINFLTFLSKPIELQFDCITKTDSKDKFIQLGRRLVSYVKKNKENIERIDLIPFYVIKSLLENKAQLDHIISFIDIVVKEGIYPENKLKNFILKYLIENYSDNLISSIQLISIMKKIDTTIIKLGTICTDVDLAVKFISILDKEKITFNLIDIMKNNFIKADTLITSTVDYLSKLSKDFRYNQFNFIDSNKEDICLLIQYINYNLSNSNEREVYSLGNVISIFMDFYPVYKKDILNIIQANQTLFLSKEEMTELIKKFIPFADDSRNKQAITNFLPLIANNKELYDELSLILNYITIKEVFNKYQIPTDLLDCGYRNVQADKILEIYLIKTFNVDQIMSIEDFVQKRPVKDIQDALHLINEDFLHLLFLFFYKYQRDTLYTQVLHLIKTDNTLFMDCIKVIKKDKTQKAFIEYIDKNKFKTYLLENSKQFSLFYDETLFNTKQNINFSLSKDNLDILSILAIEKLSLTPKTSKNKSQLNEDFTKEREVINEFYNDDPNNSRERTLENLLKLYHEKNIESKSQINYKYSLHPKLIDLLNKQNYGHFINNVKINFGSKIKLYKFLIINNIISIDHVFLYENLPIDKITNIISIRMLFNLYNDKTQNQIEQFMDGKLVIENNQINKITNELIEVNLTKLKSFSYFNLLFLLKHLSFNLKSVTLLSEIKLPLMKIISHICPKFNLLPFLPNFMTDIYPNNKNIIDRYYNDFTPITNLNFFIEQTNIQKKYQFAEIYKGISINNWANFSKIFNDLSEIKVNVLLVFVIKLCYNYSNTSGVLIHKAKNGCIYLMNLINTFRLSIDEIKLVCNELYSYPQITAILEGSQNILLLNEYVPKNIKNYSTSKRILVNELLSIYPQLKEFPIYVHLNKIFQIKNCIINSIPDSETKATYNKIRELTDFNELNRAVKSYPKIQSEIYNIYTLN